ncbi:ABC transporter ATP-binding protein [Aerococcus sp. 1KP-2016]|uniref:ABC transporter ATP-binding protein n=1 Tax=Aerococcus sp. 1KP-2016 TaxID=1981982 RepID=UPI000B980AC0|nr:ABC transporter ATP-binding protein [Aerococcus sp. 1KP-2016]OYQ66409.1 multidrug ABC transporter ATP-binding protein [Aerococcus sp. 1KP-2016]
MTLKVTNLTGGYSSQPVLHDLNFEIQSGEIVGLIGLNGAGKSTTIKHIIGLMKAMKGEITIDEYKLDTDMNNYRQSFTYIPEMPVLYDALTLKEHIELTGMAYGLSKEIALQNAQPLLEMFRLDNRLDWLPIHFSKGMKQKVMLVCAFLVETALYVIDEPFLGLDPLAIHDLIETLKLKKEAGASILMSTHVLATAQQYCDRFIFLQEGHVIAIGTIDDIRAQFDMPDASLDDLYIRLAKGADDELV